MDKRELAESWASYVALSIRGVSFIFEGPVHAITLATFEMGIDMLESQQALKIDVSHWAMVAHTFHPSRGRGKWISVSLRLTWSTE